MKERDDNKKELDHWNALNSKAEDVVAGLELIKLGEDPALLKEITGQLAQLKKDLRTEELKLYFTDEYDTHNAFLSIHPGAGGTESQDWASMLLRMYNRWAERKGFTIEMVDYQPGEEAGLKDVTLFVSGPNAYGFLKSEKGVHRLVRTSPFNAKGLRHTSFALVEFIPKFEQINLSDIVIPEEELKIEYSRSGGPGGQNVNKRETAVRVVHLSTNISAHSDNQRSQAQNKEKAVQIVKGKLYVWREEEKKKKEQGLYVSKTMEIEWGNQIRSYVLHPYKMVKDHRSGVETAKVEEVLDGDIEEFLL